MIAGQTYISKPYLHIQGTVMLWVPRATPEFAQAKCLNFHKGELEVLTYCE